MVGSDCASLVLSLCSLPPPSLRLASWRYRHTPPSLPRSAESISPSPTTTTTTAAADRGRNREVLHARAHGCNLYAAAVADAAHPRWFSLVLVLRRYYRPTTTTRKPRSPLPCTVYVHTDRSVCTVCGGGGGGGGKGLLPGTGCFCLLYHVALHTYVRVLEWQGEGRRRKHPLSLTSSSFRQGRRESEGREEGKKEGGVESLCRSDASFLSPLLANGESGRGGRMRLLARSASLWSVREKQQEKEAASASEGEEKDGDEAQRRSVGRSVRSSNHPAILEGGQTSSAVA